MLKNKKGWKNAETEGWKTGELIGNYARIIYNCLEFRNSKEERSRVPIFFVLEKQSRAMVSNPLWIPVQGTWRVPPCRRTVATQPVSPLRVLSANFPPCFPSSHLLLDSYNPIDVALHERDASTRISPLPDCHCVYLLACVVGGTNVTTRYDRIILRTFVCPPPSRLILHPVFPSPSPFFFF